jgi:hypothetical protein
MAKDNTLLYIGLGAAVLYFITKNQQAPATAPGTKPILNAAGQLTTKTLPNQANPLTSLISAGSSVLNLLKGGQTTPAGQPQLTTISTTGPAGSDIFGNPPGSAYYGIEPDPTTQQQAPAPAALTTENSLVVPATITNPAFTYTAPADNSAVDETSGIYDSSASYTNEG